MKKSEKIKAWFEEHKKAIGDNAVRIFWYALGLGVGYFVTDRISDIQVGCGLEKLANQGILKFFDPSTGLEVSVDKAVEIAEKLNKK